MVINLWSSWNFASIEDIIRTCNPIIVFSKFTYNKKILVKFDEFFGEKHFPLMFIEC